MDETMVCCVCGVTKKSRWSEASLYHRSLHSPFVFVVQQHEGSRIAIPDECLHEMTHAERS